jgi:transposase
LRELDRLAEDIELLDREIAEEVIEDPSVKRLLTITGINIIVAAGLVSAIGDIRRFSSPQKLVSYVGLNPRGHQVAAVAVARKLAVQCWHLLIKDTDYKWARPALVAHKIRAMQLQAGQPEKKGNKRGAAYVLQYQGTTQSGDRCGAPR